MTADSKNATPSPTAGEIERLSQLVGKWGLEAGFLDLEDHLEPRLAALIRDSSEKLFGDCAAEMGRLQSELESKEIEWSAAMRIVAAYRARYGAGAQPPTSGLVRRFCSWIWAWREYRAACSVCRRLEPELHRLRLDLDAARSAMPASEEWQRHASATLPANYHFQKNRGAQARPEKEIDNDTSKNRNFILHRAN